MRLSLKEAAWLTLAAIGIVVLFIGNGVCQP
jgi:hypothetical protein